MNAAMRGVADRMTERIALGWKVAGKVGGGAVVAVTQHFAQLLHSPFAWRDLCEPSFLADGAAFFMCLCS